MEVAFVVNIYNNDEGKQIVILNIFQSYYFALNNLQDIMSNAR